MCGPATSGRGVRALAAPTCRTAGDRAAAQSGGDPGGAPGRLRSSSEALSGQGDSRTGQLRPHRRVQLRRRRATWRRSQLQPGRRRGRSSVTGLRAAATARCATGHLSRPGPAGTPAQVPKISSVWLTSAKPCSPATRSAHCSTAGPATSHRAARTPRQTRWWWCWRAAAAVERLAGVGADASRARRRRPATAPRGRPSTARPGRRAVAQPGVHLLRAVEALEVVRRRRERLRADGWCGPCSGHGCTRHADLRIGEAGRTRVRGDAGCAPASEDAEVALARGRAPLARPRSARGRASSAASSAGRRRHRACGRCSPAGTAWAPTAGRCRRPR